VEDDDDHTGHRRSLASGRPGLARQVRAYVGLGANLGDAESTIAAAIHALAVLPGARLRAVSRLYATVPVGVADQPEFRNAVVGIDVPAGPDPETGSVALLVALKGIERAFGRRERKRWGPREVDLDLLVFGRAAIAVERPLEARSADPAKPTDLVVPHRLAGERLFVLAPLADLAPGLVPPGWHETVAAARARREAGEGTAAVRPIARWNGAGWDAMRVPGSA
jgi:2-amino-4-hydroxy-6-hydroxymethyldihydropteridine diphosphokinase